MDKTEKTLNWYNKADCLSLLNNLDCEIKIKNQYEEELEWYYKALKINPTHVYLYRDKQVYWQENAYEIKMMDQFEEAIQWYDKALIINPQEVLCLWGRGKYNQFFG